MPKPFKYADGSEEQRPRTEKEIEREMEIAAHSQWHPRKPERRKRDFGGPIQYVSLSGLFIQGDPKQNRRKKMDQRHG